MFTRLFETREATCRPLTGCLLFVFQLSAAFGCADPIDCGVEGDQSVTPIIGPTTAPNSRKIGLSEEEAHVRAGLIASVQNSASDQYTFKLPQRIKNAVMRAPQHAVADNPTQQYRVRVAGGTVRLESIALDEDAPHLGEAWQLGVALSAVGRGTSFIPVSCDDDGITIAKNRASFQHSSGIEQWFVNGPLGVEQGFLLTEQIAVNADTNSARETSDDLLIKLILSGSLTAEGSEQGDVLFRSSRGEIILRYTDLFVRDADGQRIAAIMELGENAIFLRIEDRLAKYPIEIDPLIGKEQAVLYPSATTTTAYRHGSSVAVQGSIAVVGAPGQKPSATGTVYVYEKNGVFWIEQTKLTPGGGLKTSEFGKSVALDNDTLLVGANVTWSNSTKGAVYVFVLSGNGWTEQAVIVGNDWSFGDAVAVDADAAAIGSPKYEDAAYIYFRTGGIWAEQAKLTAADMVNSPGPTFFGRSVDIDGDTVIVGATRPLHSGYGYGGGVYVFVRNSSSQWLLQGKLETLDDNFGYSVSLRGDEALVGAPGDSGTAYIFVRDGNVWNVQKKFVGDPNFPLEHFGASVAFDGDTAAVGAFSGIYNSGQDIVRVFARTSSDWMQQAEFTIAKTQVYGHTIGLSADELFVGSPYYSGDGFLSGEVYTFERNGSTWTGPETLGPNGGDCEDHRFGYSVDIDGDTAVVGAVGDDQFDWFSGAVYLYSRVGTQWVEQDRITNCQSAPCSPYWFFGQSVAVDGDTLIVGAGNQFLPDASAYVYTNSSSGWTQQAELKVAVNAWIGRSMTTVAIDGDTAIVGTHVGGEWAGEQIRADIFVRNGNTWTLESTLLEHTSYSCNEPVWYSYPKWVDVQGDTAIVGTLCAYPAGVAATIYKKNGTTWTEQEKLYDGSYQNHTVALSGDTALVGVGSYGYQNVVAFVKSGTNWTEQDQLMISPGTDWSHFGYSLAIHGNTAIVGAPGDSENAVYMGSAYIYTRTGNRWNMQSKITAADGAQNDFISNTVALSGNDLIIGAASKGLGGVSYIYTLNKDSGDPCGDDSECHSGFCIDDVCCESECAGGIKDDCQACSIASGALENGICHSLPDGNGCNDANGCTQTDTCHSGTCVGQNPVICIALDQCHLVGSCDPTTGVCPDPLKPDGSSCDDGNSCTQLDFCQSGICTGAEPVTCLPMDGCHETGVCNIDSGLCSNPKKPNGAPCPTGVCQNGTCVDVSDGGSGGTSGGVGGGNESLGGQGGGTVGHTVSSGGNSTRRSPVEIYGRGCTCRLGEDGSRRGENCWWAVVLGLLAARRRVKLRTVVM